MKNLFKAFLLLSFVLFATASFAIPKLQLDISDSIYDYDTDTVVATTETFTLYALIDPDLVGENAFVITAAVSPQISVVGDLGSFEFDNETINVTSDMVLSDTKTDPPIASHGIFETYFTEFDFYYNEDTFTEITAYNVEPEDNVVEGDEGEVEEIAGDILYQVAFEVDMSNFSADYIIHFDLYTYFGDKEKLYFAPFSHDAESAPVPEPSTLLLLGAGITGLAFYRRKKH